LFDIKLGKFNELTKYIGFDYYLDSILLKSMFWYRLDINACAPLELDSLH